MSTEPPDPQHPSERNTNDLNEKVHHPYVTKWRSFPQARLKDQIALLAIWVIDLAIKLMTLTPMNSLVQVSLESIIYLKGMQAPNGHIETGVASIEALGHVKDLDEAIEHLNRIVTLTPRNSPHLAEVLDNLGCSFRRRFEQFGDVKDIEEAIKRQTDAVNLISLDDSHRPLMLSSLGYSFMRRFERLREVGDVDAAIERLTEAIDLIPANSPERPLWLNNLGSSFIRRFERLEEVKDIDAAIGRLTEAVNLMPLKNHERSEKLNNLGNSLMYRFLRVGERKDIDAAIERLTEAVNLTPQGTRDRSSWLNSLGNALMRRFERFGQVEDLDAAIGWLTEAVDCVPVGRPERSAKLNNLGTLLTRRFERFGDVKDIDVAIEQLTEAVNLTPVNSPYRPIRLNNLGNALMRRFGRFKEGKDIDTAIVRQTEAVNLTPIDNLDRPRWLNNLGTSLICRYEWFGEVKDIDVGIGRLIEALTLSPPDSPQRPTWLNNLGGSLLRRFERFGKADDLDAAVARLTESVSLTPLDNPRHPGRLGNLGASLVRRFNRSGELKDIDVAIGLLNKAVDLTPQDSPDRLNWLDSLGTSLMYRFERLGQVKDIDAAIGRQTKAVDLTAHDSPDRPARLNSLGSSLMYRFERLREVKDINAAVARQSEAVGLTLVNNPDWAMWLDSLGISLMRRFEWLGEVKDIDGAIGRQTKSVDLTAHDSPDRPARLNNLGISLRHRFARIGEVKDINAAIVQQTETVDLTPIDSFNRPTYLSSLGYSLITRFKSSGDIRDRERAANLFRSSYTSIYGSPVDRIQASLQYARIFHSQNDFTSASEAYTCAVHLLPQIAWIGLDTVSQLDQLTGGVQVFGSHAASCLISMALQDTDHEQQHLGRAVEILDQTRSILWFHASNLRQNLRELRAVNQKWADELDHARGILQKGSFRNPNKPLIELEEQQYRRSAERWEEVVLKVRKLPGFAHFLLPPPISELREAANGGPVVVINISTYRNDALIIPPGGSLELLPLSSEAATRVKNLAEQQREIFPSGYSRTGQIWEDTPKSELMLKILHETWTLLGEPIAKKLEECGILDSRMSSKPRVWWCLTGEVTFLPIHGCHPTPDKDAIQPIGMMDLVVSSYTPTLSTLARAQRRQTPQSLRVLAVGQPESRGYRSLQHVEDEIKFIRGRLDHNTTILENSKATVDAVSTALPTHSWVHFACHGIQNHDNPLESGLALHDGQLLTLSRLAQSQPKGAEFAFVSSCESATGSKNLPNESVHLAAGLQFLGFRGVIGTMWSVGDKDALKVAKAVYEELFKDGMEKARASDAAVALHRAVCRLRDEEKVPAIRWIPFVHFGF